jgi:hypothetical protein
VSSSGNARVSADAVRGYVEQVQPFGPQLRVSGWAADVARGRAADCVLLLSGDRLVAAGTPYLARADVARDHGAAVARSGFSIVAAARTDSRRSRRHACARSLADGRASELTRLPAT